jgi:hypothetical protein
LPNNATIMLVAIYDLLRCQRNELGHPRETPPNIERQRTPSQLRAKPALSETDVARRHFGRDTRDSRDETVNIGLRASRVGLA